MNTPDQPDGAPSPDQPNGPQPGQGWGQPAQPHPGQQSWGQSGPSTPWNQPAPGQPGPGQPRQQPWGQQPPPGQQPWGQQPPPGQQPWAQQGQQPWGAQPGSPAAGQPWSGQQAFGQLDPKKAGARTWLPIAGGVIGVLVVLGLLVNGFGASDPEVGDCVQRAGDGIEVVDCDSSEAQYRVVGLDEERADLTQSEFYGTDSTCSQFTGITQQVWIGPLDDSGASGDIYCLGNV